MSIMHAGHGMKKMASSSSSILLVLIVLLAVFVSGANGQRRPPGPPPPLPPRTTASPPPSTTRPSTTGPTPPPSKPTPTHQHHHKITNHAAEHRMHPLRASHDSILGHPAIPHRGSPRTNPPSAIPKHNAVIASRRITEGCKGIHATAHGASLVCCGNSSRLLEDCEFAQQCTAQEECSCSLTLTSKLSCSLGSLPDTFEWKDHAQHRSPMECARPNLPGNDTATPYAIRVEGWNDNTTAPFLQSLCSLNVSSLTLLEVGPQISKWDLTKCFPRLQNLEISLQRQTRLDIYQLFRSLRWLKTLRIVNVDFDFWHSVSPWVSSISYLHIESSSMRELPKWLTAARSLKRVYIQATRLFSIEVIAAMTGLQSAKLAWNKIGNLSEIQIKSTGIFDIDLSNNHISSYSANTFAKCSELRVLDLSHNPLASLPSGGFFHAAKMKWLKLEHTKIRTLLPEHLAGMAHLRTLSLSHTPLKTIAPYSLLPLKSLRVLNLNACNLTAIPSAVTHLCHLTHLNLDDNLLRSADSLQPDVLVHLSALSQLSIEGNPLHQFPLGLLQLSPVNTRLIRDTIRTLTLLPAWTEDPCTPYYWHMHLENASASLRALVLQWNIRRMKSEGLEYCREQFDEMAAGMGVYAEIEKSSGCAVSRRLRSSANECPTPPTDTTKATRPNQARHRNPMLSYYDPTSTPCVIVNSTHEPLLYLSVAVNVFFLVATTAFVCLCCAAGRRPRY